MITSISHPTHGYKTAIALDLQVARFHGTHLPKATIFSKLGGCSSWCQQSRQSSVSGILNVHHIQNPIVDWSKCILEVYIQNGRDRRETIYIYILVRYFARMTSGGDHNNGTRHGPRVTHGFCWWFLRQHAFDRPPDCVNFTEPTIKVGKLLSGSHGHRRWLPRPPTTTCRLFLLLNGTLKDYNCILTQRKDELEYYLESIHPMEG